MEKQTIVSKEDALMYREMEAKEIQRELGHLQDRMDAIKLETMEKIYGK